MNFAIPHGVYAEWNPFKNVGQTLLKECVIFICSLGDVAMGILNNTMLGAKIGSAMLAQTDINITSSDTKSWLKNITDTQRQNAKENGRYIEINNLEGGIGVSDYQIPNMLFSPESIFSNNIAALDVNFLNPNKYNAVSEGDKAEKKAESSASKLQSIIANWYKSFRNIAIVGLLSVLIYLGIRILISSTAADKAKYKQSLTDWFVALCLVFVIHFLMSGILMLTDKVTDLFTMNNDTAIIVSAKKEDGTQQQEFKTNLIGLVRFKTQTSDWYEVTAYGFIYVVLVIYTYVFTFMYLKRLLYMAFFTMIAPLVALTYPLDKLGDSKAQAFNMWFKEYTMNAIIQPVHLILYTVFVSSAIELATDNMLYAIVAIGFLMPAERFIKKMFGLDKGETVKDSGSFAAGALTMTGLNKLSSFAKNGFKDNSSKLAKGANSTDNNSSGVMPNKVKRAGLAASMGAGLPQPGGAQPGGAQPGGAQPGGAQPGGAQPGGAQPGGAQPGGAQPGGAQPGGAQPGGAQPGGTQPGRTNARGRQIAGTQQPTRKPLRQRAKKRLALAAPKIAKGVYKGARVASTVGGALAGGMIGAAAGIASGDASKMFQYGAAGATAGGTIGQGISGLANPDRIVSAKDEFKQWRQTTAEQMKYNKDVANFGEVYAAKEAKKRENDRMKTNYLKDKKEQEKAAKMAAKIGAPDDIDLKSFMEANWDYMEAGITDEKLREKALKAEKDYGGIGGAGHQAMIDLADYSTDFSKEYITDRDKNNQLKQQLAVEFNNNTALMNQAEEVLAKIYGVNKVY